MFVNLLKSMLHNLGVVVYLHLADNENKPVRSRQRGVNQTAMVSPPGLTRPCGALFLCRWAYLAPQPHDHCATSLSTDSLAAAMAARERAAPPARSRREL